jgi:transposase
VKFVNHLKPSEIKALEEGYESSSSAKFRVRCHAIILNNKGYKIDRISDILSRTRNTVSEWIDLWMADGLEGLKHEPPPGRNTIYSEEELDLLKKYVDEQPHQLREVQHRLEQATGKKACLDTVKRALKKSGVQF